MTITGNWRNQMNKQEAIERIKNIDTLNINDMVAGQQVDMVIKNQVIDIVSQIDEQQKVVVPKFVAEWIKKYRHAHTLLQVFKAAEKEQITVSSCASDFLLKRNIILTFLTLFSVDHRAWIDTL